MINDDDYMIDEKTQQPLGVVSDLNNELGSLLKKPITIGEKIDFIVENNKILGIENQMLKLWVAQLLSNDGFDGGCYDAQKLRIAREKLQEILDKPISI